MRFEWGPVKAPGNLRKHGVSFEKASSVFYDPLAATGTDPDHSEGEDRWMTFGMSSQGRLQIVAHAELNGVIRIISSPIATRIERQIHEQED